MICIRKLITYLSRALPLCALGLLASPPARPLCSATPQAAVAGYRENLAAATDGTPGQGFRVWRTLKDPGLGRQWFWVEACSGPERPAQLLWIPLVAEQNQPEAPVAVEDQVDDQVLVRLGDAVAVVKSGDVFSMRLSGQALESGERGKRMRVRIDAWHKGMVVIGTVSGKDEIQLGQ